MDEQPEPESLNTELIDVLLGYIRSLSQVISEQRARIAELEQ